MEVLAFILGQHARVGENSPVALLPQYEMNCIVGLIDPVKVDVIVNNSHGKHSLYTNTDVILLRRPGLASNINIVGRSAFITTVPDVRNCYAVSLLTGVVRPMPGSVAGANLIGFDDGLVTVAAFAKYEGTAVTVVNNGTTDTVRLEGVDKCVAEHLIYGTGQGIIVVVGSDVFYVFKNASNDKYVATRLPEGHYVSSDIRHQFKNERVRINVTTRGCELTRNTEGDDKVATSARYASHEITSEGWPSDSQTVSV